MYQSIKAIRPRPHGRVAIGIDDGGKVVVVRRKLVANLVEIGLAKLFAHNCKYVASKNNIVRFVCYICVMRLVIDNIKKEHLKWLTEMAKTLKFNVTEVELTEDEEDAYLLASMEAVKDEPNLSKEESDEFENWLKSVK